MSLTGAIVSRFDDDNDSTINALTALVSICYADEVPPALIDKMPYLVISEISETPLVDGKDYSFRIDTAAIQVDVFDVTKDSCDLILEAWEDAYRETTLTITDATQIGLPIIRGRTIFEEEDSIWHGVLDVAYMLEADLGGE